MRSRADRVLVVGYGNLLRGDDAAGPRVARTLRSCGFPAIEVHQLTPELAALVSRVQLAIFVDADTALAPGQVRVTPVREGGESPLEHHASPAGVLRLAREAYGQAPPALLIAIGGESYELGRKLSRPARRAVRQVVNLCMNRV